MKSQIYGNGGKLASREKFWGSPKIVLDPWKKMVEEEILYKCMPPSFATEHRVGSPKLGLTADTTNFEGGNNEKDEA